MAVDTQRLVDVIEATLRRHAVPSARISIALVDDAEIAHLNERHLDHQGPTDVLTFDLGDEWTPDRAGGWAVEGDIVVSVDTAAREADRRGHDLPSELALYAVHGTLHLLGYDDADETDAARMHAMEDEVLRAAGVGPVYGSQP